MYQLDGGVYLSRSDEGNTAGSQQQDACVGLRSSVSGWHAEEEEARGL